MQVRPLRADHRGVGVQRAVHRGSAHPRTTNVVGGVGNGWKVALTTLMNERAGLAFGLQVALKIQLDELTEQAAARGLLDDPVVADKLGELHLKCEILRLTAYRGLSATMKYGQPGPEGSLTKWMWSETNQQFAAGRRGHPRPRGADRRLALGLRPAALARQHDRGRHHRDPQEHRRRAGPRAPADALKGTTMNFDFTDDQHEIKRTARELLAKRSPFERVRDGGRVRDLRRRRVAGADRARLAGHRDPRGRRRAGARHRRARDPARGARVRVRGLALPLQRHGRAAHRAGGQRRASASGGWAGSPTARRPARSGSPSRAWRSSCPTRTPPR